MEQSQTSAFDYQIRLFTAENGYRIRRPSRLAGGRDMSSVQDRRKSMKEIAESIVVNDELKHAAARTKASEPRQ